MLTGSSASLISHQLQHFFSKHTPKYSILNRIYKLQDKINLNNLPNKSYDGMHLMESIIFILLLQIYKHFKIFKLQYKIWKWFCWRWSNPLSWTEQYVSTFAHIYSSELCEGVGTFIILAFYFSLSLHQKPASSVADNKALSSQSDRAQWHINNSGLKWKAPSNLTGDLKWSCIQPNTLVFN